MIEGEADACLLLRGERSEKLCDKSLRFWLFVGERISEQRSRDQRADAGF